jgi:hypothetical protein
VNIGNVKTFDLCNDEDVNIGDKFKDQHGRIWEVIEVVTSLHHPLFKCKLISNIKGK